MIDVKSLSAINAYLASTVLARAPLAFDSGKAGWKIDKDGKMELKDGNPVWIDANGGESTIEGGVISRLNGEARDLRKRAEDAEKALQPFKDLDPVIARKAIDDIKKIDTKKLIDAGEVDKVREEMRGEFTKQLDEAKGATTALQQKYDNQVLTNVFANSEFIRERVAMPRDFFESTMRNNFTVKDGKIEARDRHGNPVMSKKSPGDYADPEEALFLLVDQHPQKATILRAPNDGHSGTGGTGGGAGRPGQRTMTRSAYEAANPMDKAAAATAMGKGELTIVE